MRKESDMEKTMHWTESNVEAFIQKLTFDFITQLEKAMESNPDINQSVLAQKLNVSEGAVSQILNNPRNLTLKTMVRYARALGMKLALVAYDDSDPDNSRGPINSDIFRLCWERAEKPRTFRAFQQPDAPKMSAQTLTVSSPRVKVGSDYNALRLVGGSDGSLSAGAAVGGSSDWTKKRAS
jgi:transcriptional regulator with XRE-family HTH domain